MLGGDGIKPGHRLGKYEIVRKLAVGGMAEIYLARTPGLAGFEKLVVLKRILPSITEDPGFVQMFLDEARLAATLRHPNIGDVFDIGDEDGSYYFAMEFIHGQDARTIKLATDEAKRAIPIEIGVGIITGVAYALAYAHAKTGPTGPLGIVHRDVSPSNILVSYDGAVKLVDFGIARADTRSQSVKTKTGMLKGKGPYMSPEQCRGKPLDRRSDLFSLGTVLYELTTGRRPFEGHSEYDTLEMIVLGKAEAPSVQMPAYPPELEVIVMRLLEREPANRYQSADDVLIDLERLVKDTGLLVSERVVARYMRELFAEEIAEWEREQVNPEGLSLDLDPPTQPPGSVVLDNQPTTEVRLDQLALEHGEAMQPLLVTPDVQVFLRPTRDKVPAVDEAAPARSRPPSSPPPPSPPPPSPPPPSLPLPSPPPPSKPAPGPAPVNARVAAARLGSPTRPPPVTAALAVPPPQLAPRPMPTGPLIPRTATGTKTDATLHPRGEHPTARSSSDDLLAIAQESAEGTSPARPVPGLPTINTRPTRDDFDGDFEHEDPPSYDQTLRQLPQDQTRGDGVPRFDPVHARGNEILTEVDAGKPGEETAAERSLRRVTALITRCSRWLASGDLDQAMVAAELALEEDTSDEAVVLALVRGQPILLGAFEAFLGDRSRPVALGRPLGELAKLELDQRSAFLLSCVDGTSSIDEVIEASKIPRFEACRSLCRLILRKMIITG